MAIKFLNTATAATQSVGDNSTKIATTAYADAAASAVPIGNYLPLSAGASKPLTGGLHIPHYIYHAGNTGTVIGYPSVNRFVIGTNSVTRVDVTDAGLSLGDYQTNVSVSTILDEDDMASDSATALVTQQSIKAYVDAQTPGAGVFLPLSAGSSYPLTGDLYITKAATPLIQLTDTTNSKTLLLGVDDANAFIRTGASENLYLQVNGGTNAITILNNSNVGIGTTSPDYKLDVEGSVNNDDIAIRINNTFDDNLATSNPTSVLWLGVASNNGYLRVHGAPANTAAKHQIDLGSTAGSSFLTFSPGNAERMRIATNGAIQFNDYNSTNNTGTPTYLLGTDASGNIVKTNTIPGSAAGPYLPLAGGTLSGNLSIDIADGGSAPAMTAVFNLRGYEGRGAGIKIKDSVNSATSPSSREWFVGSGYSNSGFNIGYSSTGSQSSYSAQSKLNISTSGQVTIPGDVGIGTTNPGAKLDIQKNDDTVYDPSADDGQRGIGATIQLNNNSTVTNTFGQIMHDTDSSGQAIARMVFLDAGTASSAIAFVTENAEQKGERLRIAPNGDVGIGTNDPDQKLHIKGGDIQTQDTTGSNGVLRIRATITGTPSTGGYPNVGAGDAVIEGGGTTQRRAGVITLMNGDSSISSGQDLGVIQFVGKDDSTNGYCTSQIISTTSGSTGSGASGGGILRFLTSSGGTGAAVEERMRITNTGNVGIGVTNPYWDLDVAGDIRIRDQGKLYFGNSGSIPHLQIYSDSSNNMVIDDVYTNNADVLFSIQGNVGIGDANPSSKLSVNGGIQVANDSATASAANVGTIRYQVAELNSYVDMCMQTGATTYAWVNIVQNNW